MAEFSQAKWILSLHQPNAGGLRQTDLGAAAAAAAARSSCSANGPKPQLSVGPKSQHIHTQESYIFALFQIYF